MSWADQHARTEVIHTILARAVTDPTDPHLFDGIADSERLFGGPEGILLALRYRWKIHLEAKMDQAITDGRSPVDAYLELAAEQPTLHAVLNANFQPHAVHCPALSH